MKANLALMASTQRRYRIVGNGPIFQHPKDSPNPCEYAHVLYALSRIEGSVCLAGIYNGKTNAHS